MLENKIDRNNINVGFNTPQLLALACFGTFWASLFNFFKLLCLAKDH